MRDPISFPEHARERACSGNETVRDPGLFQFIHISGQLPLVLLTGLTRPRLRTEEVSGSRQRSLRLHFPRANRDLCQRGIATRTECCEKIRLIYI